MKLERWADDTIDFIRDFVHDTKMDDKVELGTSKTSEEWWEIFLDYKEATGS